MSELNRAVEAFWSAYLKEMRRPRFWLYCVAVLGALEAAILLGSPGGLVIAAVLMGAALGLAFSR